MLSFFLSAIKVFLKVGKSLLFLIRRQRQNLPDTQNYHDSPIFEVKMSQNRTNKLIGNTAILAIGQFGSKVLVYFLTRLYTELLTTEQYSVANNISELASLLIPLISLGIGEAIFRLSKGSEFQSKEVFTDSLIIWGFGCLSFAVILPILHQIAYFNGYLLLIVFYILASILHTICTNYIRSLGKIRLYAVQGILNTVLVILLNILFLIPLKLSTVGYILSVPIADTLVTVFIVVKEKLWRNLDFHAVRRSSLRRMMKYSVPLIPTTIFMWIISISDRYMVTYFCGDGVNGLYTAAYKIPTLLGVLNSIFIYAWQISAMEEKDAQDKKKYYSSVFASYASFMFLLGGIIILCSQIVVKMMFAQSYQTAWVYIPVLCLAMILHNFASFLDSDNMVRMNSLPTMYTALAGAITNILLNFLLIYWLSLGAMGAAIATYASYLVTFLLRAFLVRKSIQIQWRQIIANHILLLLLIGTMLSEFAYWPLVGILLLLLLTLLNWKPIWQTMLNILPKSLQKRFIRHR
jgi:O-antigen/teichoic acid export membrane protein